MVLVTAQDYLLGEPNWIFKKEYFIPIQVIPYLDFIPLNNEKRFERQFFCGWVTVRATVEKLRDAIKDKFSHR